VLARLFEGHARLVIVTNGAATVRWRTRDQQGEVASFPVVTVDSTAAGDAFVGGLLFRLGEVGADGRGFAPFCADPPAIEDAIRFGAAVGALAVTRKGAFAAMPTLSEVQTLLQEHHAHA
jgi:fructokinase